MYSTAGAEKLQNACQVGFDKYYGSVMQYFPSHAFPNESFYGGYSVHTPTIAYCVGLGVRGGHWTTEASPKPDGKNSHHPELLGSSKALTRWDFRVFFLGGGGDRWWSVFYL